MTKAELVKAARDISVQMGQADKLRAQQRQSNGPAQGALESWCPPRSPFVPKKRVQPLPPAAAPCGLVMDGDRLPEHRAQCAACQNGVQAASYAGIDRTVAPPQQMFVHPKTYEALQALQKEMANGRLCCPPAYVGSGHSSWCQNAPAARKTCTCPHGEHTTDGKCPVHVTAGIRGSGFVDCKCAKCNPPEPTLAEQAAALPHLSGCDCSRCKTGRAAACCNIGWHLSLDGRACPTHAPKAKPAPYVAAIDEWDLLPDA